MMTTAHKVSSLACGKVLKHYTDVQEDIYTFP